MAKNKFLVILLYAFAAAVSAQLTSMDISRRIGLRVGFYANSCRIHSVSGGSHTIGVSHCNVFIVNRLHNFSSTHPTDPSLDPAYAETLEAVCPPNSSDSDGTTFPMDPTTPNVLDNQYYTDVQNNRGLFVSDATLLTDTNTATVVSQSAASNLIWWPKFADAMAKMAVIDVLTGEEGEIRRNCRVVN